MDVKSALEAFEAIRITVPESDRLALDAELTTRYGHIAEVAGPIVVAKATKTVRTPETESGQRLADFLNPYIFMSITDQLRVQAEFWGALGHEVPILSNDQWIQIGEKLTVNPSRRTMAAPLLELNGRIALTEESRKVFPKNKLPKNPSVTALSVHNKSSMFGELFDELGATVFDGRRSYAMRYKTTSGTVVKGRQDYIRYLQSTGRIVEGEHNTPWTWSVMDVAVRSPRIYASAKALYETVSPTATPELHIGMLLMHQANGTPNDIWHEDFVNEAVFELDKKGNPKALVLTTSVGTYPFSDQLNLSRLSADFTVDFLGVRAEESGISL